MQNLPNFKDWLHIHGNADYSVVTPHDSLILTFSIVPPLTYLTLYQLVKSSFSS